jgi:hypothetical protein
VAISLIILNHSQVYAIHLFYFIILIYSAGLYQVFHEKKTLNLAIIGLSLLICLCVLIIENSDLKESTLLTLSFFIIIVVGLLSKWILYLNKLWIHESTN